MRMYHLQFYFVPGAIYLRFAATRELIMISEWVVPGCLSLDGNSPTLCAIGD